MAVDPCEGCHYRFGRSRAPETSRTDGTTVVGEPTVSDRTESQRRHSSVLVVRDSVRFTNDLYLVGPDQRRRRHEGRSWRVADSVTQVTTLPFFVRYFPGGFHSDRDCRFVPYRQEEWTLCLHLQFPIRISVSVVRDRPRWFGRRE